MKKRLVLAMCMVLCAALLVSCGSGEAQPGAAQSGGPESTSSSGWSAGVFTPNAKYSWPQAIIDGDWPETGFGSSISRLAFEGLDLKDTYTIGCRIAYEDEKVLIFWFMQGIFGVELGNNGEAAHIFSLDFAKLFGPDHQAVIQGSHRTTVAVRKDGTRMLVGDWDDDLEPMEDWYLVDIPTLTYKKSPINARMTSAFDGAPDENLWSDEVFDEADAAGEVLTNARLGEAVYCKGHDPAAVVVLFKNYMEFTPFP